MDALSCIASLVKICTNWRSFRGSNPLKTTQNMSKMVASVVMLTFGGL